MLIKRVNLCSSSWRCFRNSMVGRQETAFPTDLQSAAGGTRTRTGFPPADFKSAASAISPQRHRESRMYPNNPSNGRGIRSFLPGRTQIVKSRSSSGTYLKSLIRLLRGQSKVAYVTSRFHFCCQRTTCIMFGYRNKLSRLDCTCVRCLVGGHSFRSYHHIMIP